MPAATLQPPVPLDRLPELLRRRGLAVALKRVQEAAAAGALPAWRDRGRYVVHEADLEMVEAYFRSHPSRPYRKRRATVARVEKE